eukprot:Skav206637  [mRNA]  locus=scaffold166:34225:39525:- [translate_table: standard]
MDSTRLGYTSSTLELLTGLTLSPHICCCFDKVSVVAELDHTITLTSKHVIVGAEILTVDHPLAGMLEGCNLHECKGGHECHTSIDVVFSIESWDLVAKNCESVVIIGAKVDHTRGRLIATDMSVGVLPYGQKSVPKTGRIRVAEVFAGAYSGWSHAVTALNKETIPVDHLWMLDFDMTCARAYTKTHPSASVCDSPRVIQNFRLREELDGSTSQFEPLYVVADLCSLWWLTVVDTVELDILMASPPCPAWSMADKAPGLARHDGVILLIFFIIAGYIQPKAIALENVASLLSHKDWPLVHKIIQFAGFEIHWQHTCDLASVVPQHRDRALLILTRRGVDLPKLRTITWPNGVPHNLDTFEAIFHGAHPWIDDTQLTQDELDLYLSLAACPKAARSKGASCTMEDMYKYRIRTGKDVASCFLTSYGKPLKLSADLIKRGGVLGSLFLEGNELRKFSPIEVALLLGTSERQWIPLDWQSALHQLGNAISRPHALLALVNSLLTVTDFPWLVDPQSLMIDLLNDHWKAGFLVVEPAGDGAFISMTSIDIHHEVPPTLPMRIVSRLVILGESFGCELQCEQGVDLKILMKLLFGYDVQYQLDMPLADPLKKVIPLPAGMKMPAYDFTVKILGNPKLALNEKYFATYSTAAGIMAVFTSKGLLVLNDLTSHLPADVILAVHLTSWFDDKVLTCCGLQGQSLPVDQRCPTFVFIAEEQDAMPPCTLEVQDLFLQPIADAFHAMVPAGQEVQLMLFLEQTGVLQAIMSMGWHMTMQLQVQNSGMALLVLAAIAGRPSISAQAMQHFLMARLFYRSMLRRCVSVNNGVRLHLKIWNTLIWNDLIDNTITGIEINEMWRKVSGVFGAASDIRFVVDGRVVVPERPMVEFARWYDKDGVVSKVCMTFSPRGGGGPQTTTATPVEDSPMSPVSVDEEFPDPVALEPINFERAISLILRQIMSRCIPDRVFFPETIRGLKIEQVNGMLQMQASITETISFMQLLRQLGVEDAIEEMGWSVFLQFCRFEHPAVVRMVIVPRPGVQCMTREGVLAVILGALYAFSLPRPVPLSDDAVYVKVKLWSCWVFEGYLSGETLCNTLLEHWVAIGTFVSREEVFRLVCHGKQCSNEFPIKDYCRIDAFRRKVASFHLIRRLRGGGKGPPPSQISQVKTELATFLLKSGADLKEVSVFVDKILMVVGVPTLARIVAIQESHMRLDALEKLAQSVNIKPIVINSPAKSTGNAKKNPPQKQRLTMKAKDFRIQEGFFKKESGEPCERCEFMQAGSHGIVLMDPEEAYAWIKDALKISPDELGLLVLGTCPVKGSQRCHHVHTPAVSQDGKNVLISTCLHQMGEKSVAWETPQKGDVAVTNTTILAVTVFRDELSEEAWEQVVKSPVKATIDILQSAGVTLKTASPPWGRSWQLRGAKVDASVASSLQFHCRVEASDIADLLKSAGARGVYLTPKVDGNQVDPSFAVVWTQATLDELKIKLSSSPNHLGLVRVDKAGGRKVNRGIRCYSKDYAALFAVLKPGVQASNHIQCKVFAKLAPTPVGASQQQVQEWLAQVGWTGKAIKPLGSSTWLIGAPERPSECFATWNSQTVLLQWLPEKPAFSNQILVAGPRPKMEKQKDNAQSGDDDPWGNYIRTSGSTGLVGASKSSATPAKQNEGPTEQRLNLQAKQIQELKNAVDTIHARVDDSVASQKHFQSEVQKGFAQVRNEFAEACGGFEKSLANALSTQDQKFQSNFSELKELLAAKNTPVKKKQKKGETQAVPSDDDEM